MCGDREMSKLKVERNLQEGTLTIDGIEFDKEQTKAIDDFLDCFAKKLEKDVTKKILKDVFNPSLCGDLGEFCGTGWIYDIDEANAIFKEHGLDLEVEE